MDYKPELLELLFFDGTMLRLKKHIGRQGFAYIAKAAETAGASYDGKFQGFNFGFIAHEYRRELAQDLIHGKFHGLSKKVEIAKKSSEIMYFLTKLDRSGAVKNNDYDALAVLKLEFNQIVKGAKDSNWRYLDRKAIINLIRINSMTNFIKWESLIPKKIQ